MKKILQFAVNRPASMIVLVAAIIIMGFFTLSKLPVNLFPEMDIPVAAVITSYPGAGPEEVESQISKPLEDSLTTLSNLKEIQSTSNSGSSMVIISYNWGTDMDNAIIDIRDKVGMVEKYLPDGAEKPMVLKLDPNMMPVIQIGMRGGDLSLTQLQSIAEDIVEPRLSRIPEVASVIITGGQEREVSVEVDPVKMQNYGLSLSQVSQILRSENFNMSNGTINHGDRDYYVRSMQEFESVEDIKDVAILTPDGRTVYLRDIAQIKDTYKDISQITRVNGENSVGIHALKQTDANTVSACEAVKAELQKLEQELDADIDFEIVIDQAEYINDSLNATKKTLMEGAVLAVLVLLLFLRNLRSTSIIFTAIPLSIISAFILMYFSHNTINMITLGAMALGVGRMVDDSIVVFENIFRHRSMGLMPREAAIKGAGEVGGAVVASTLTIMAVFLPIMFVDGIAGIMFKPLAMTICFAILCSLFVAITVVPLMSSRMLTDKAMMPKEGKVGIMVSTARKFGDRIDRLSERYKVLLQWALRNRKKVILTVIVLMVLSIVAFPMIGAEFMPSSDSGEIAVNIETDKGALLAKTDAVSRQAEEMLAEIPEVDVIFTSVGSSGNMLSAGAEANKSTLSVNLLPKDERSKDVDTVAEDIRQQLNTVSGAKITVKVQSEGPSSSGSPVNIQVSGDDLTMLRELSTEVEDIVGSVPGTREVSSSLADGNPEMQVRVNRKRAASFGLTPMQVANEISTAINGSVSTRYRIEGDEVDVRLRCSQDDNQDFEYLANLNILTPSGIPVKLSQLASFELAQGPVEIIRADQVRRAEISADLLNRDLKSVMKDIRVKVNDLDVPAGYQIEFGGADKDMMESFASLGLALLLAIMLVYVVMVVQYESFFDPFIIMFSVPTSIIGVVAALLITGKSFSVPAFLGLIMLVGIVVSNAIILVDYLKQLRAGGMERNDAIIEAGRIRLRPILMTAFSTLLAMLPMALGIGEGSETNQPLAIVIIGGLLFSTLITLVLVPVVYSIFDDFGNRFRCKKSMLDELDEKPLEIN